LWTTGKALINLFFLLQVIFPSASNRQVRSSTTYSNIFKGFHIEKEIIYAYIGDHDHKELQKEWKKLQGGR
jgi:hypothetical protein